MSDFEDDIDDQLLELAGATEKKKRRRQHSGGSAGGGDGSGSRKRKAERMDSDSDMENVESEDELADPYPLEGKYKDEADKRELLAMTEIRREEILEERAEKRQHIQNARQIADMVRQQRGASGADDSTSRAKRQNRGGGKDKTNKFDELKAKRKAKDDRKRSKAEGSPSQTRDRSSSPQDMDISDSESEDGQITKEQQEEDRIRSLTGGYESHRKTKEADLPCEFEDLEKCRLTRTAMSKHYVKPWFEDYVKDSWVKYLIGGSNSAPVYRLCQVVNLAPDLVQPYKVDDKIFDQAFELKHGKSTKVFNMDKVSNAPFLRNEFEWLQKTCAVDGVSLPSKQALEKKTAQMEKLLTQPMTETDINAMLARKTRLQAATAPMGALSTLERSRFIQERTLAFRREDYSEVELIDAKLQADETLRQGTTDGMSSTGQKKETTAELLVKVNERNRKANTEAVRRAEIAESERKRKERKMAASGRGTSTHLDPSARLKTLPRTFNSATAPGTPAGGSKNGSPAPPSNILSNAALAESAPAAPVKPGGTLEDSLIHSVDIDLGDF